MQHHGIPQPSRLSLDQAIDQMVTRYVVSAERHDMARAHTRYAAIKRLRSAKFDQEHPL